MKNYQINPLRNICRQHPQWPAIKVATSITQLPRPVINQIVTAYLPVLVRRSNTTDQKNTVYARARLRNAITKGEL